MAEIRVERRGEALKGHAQARVEERKHRGPYRGLETMALVPRGVQHIG